MSQPLSIHWPDGLSTEQFLSGYWQKKPLLIRNAFPDFDNPLTADELGGLALDEEINSRLILQQSSDQWHLQQGPFSEEELTTLPAEGWSLLVSDIEKHLDGFYQYLQPFRFIPDWQIDDLMISYAPTGASVGAHIDEYDVFLLQASGQRQWSIDSSPEIDRSFIPDLDIKILQNFHASEQWTLNPGDMLYLPPGVPHHGVSLDNNCMTWSIGFRAVAHADLLTELATQIAADLPDTARFRDSVLAKQNHPAEISAETLTELRRLWDQLTNIDEENFNRVAGNILTRRSDAIEPNESQQADSIEDLLGATSVTRNAASRLAFVQSAGVAILHVDGRSYTVSEELARLLCETHIYTQDELQRNANDQSDRDCLLALWQRGVLTEPEQ